MLNSDFRPLCRVTLPYRERQHYMHSFDLAYPVMAEGYEDYLEPVTQLCKAAGATTGIAHMTVDEKIVLQGMSQRRPKPHVDGCFMPSKMSWGSGGWNHYCNDIGSGGFKRMPVIIAASKVGCRAWKGIFEAEPRDDGDLSHIPLGEGETLMENTGYLLSPDCIHESIIQNVSIHRSFLRIALPVEFKF